MDGRKTTSTGLDGRTGFVVAGPAQGVEADADLLRDVPARSISP